jgi:hypothetical protein
LIFGTASLGSRYSKKDSLAILTQAYNAGFRHFDTAPSYGDGQSEEILRRFLATHKLPSDIYITSKYGIDKPNSGHTYRARKRVYQFLRKKLSVLDHLAKRLRPSVVHLKKTEHDAIVCHVSELNKKFKGTTISLVLHDISLEELGVMDVSGLLTKLKASFPKMSVGYSASHDDVHKNVGVYFDFVNISWKSALEHAQHLPQEVRLYGVSQELGIAQTCVVDLEREYQKTVQLIVFSANPRRIAKFLEH